MRAAPYRFGVIDAILDLWYGPHSIQYSVFVSAPRESGVGSVCDASRDKAKSCTRARPLDRDGGRHPRSRRLFWGSQSVSFTDPRIDLASERHVSREELTASFEAFRSQETAIFFKQHLTETERAKARPTS
jgi:hypothetical protein